MWNIFSIDKFIPHRELTKQKNKNVFFDVSMSIWRNFEKKNFNIQREKNAPFGAEKKRKKKNGKRENKRNSTCVLRWQIFILQKIILLITRKWRNKKPLTENHNTFFHVKCLFHWKIYSSQGIISTKKTFFPREKEKTNLFNGKQKTPLLGGDRIFPQSLCRERFFFHSACVR